MAAYLVVEHIITDAAKFEEYRIKVGPMIAKHGGRYLTRGGSHKMPEGGHWKPERVVIIEFPGHGFAQRLVQLAGISAADCASQAIHQRHGYDVHARRRLTDRLIQTERRRLRPSRLFFDDSLQLGKLKATTVTLYRRARDRAVRAEHATVARKRLQALAATFAVVEELA